MPTEKCELYSNRVTELIEEAVDRTSIKEGVGEKELSKVARIEEGIDEDTVEVEIGDNELSDAVEFTVSVEDGDTR